MASPKDTAVHLGGSQLTVNEDDGDFYDLESAFVSSELHLDLKSVAFEANMIQIDCFQHLTAVAFTNPAVVSCTRNPVMKRTYLEAKIRHQHRPIGQLTTFTPLT